MRRKLCILLALLIFCCPLSSAMAAQTIKLSASNVAETGKIVLSWQKLKEAAKYELYRATSKAGSFERIYTGSGQKHTDKKSSAGRSYYYYVRAYSSKGKLLAASNTLSRCCDLPAPKLSSGNEAKSGKPHLKWQELRGAKSYELYRSGTKDGKYTKLSTTTKMSYTDTSAKAGYVYYYKLKALSEDTKNADSAFSSISSRCCDCPQPVGLRSTWTDKGAVRLRWDLVSSATHYLVYRADTQKGEYKILAKTDLGSYTDSSAKPGYYYFYRISAVNSKRSSSESSPAKLTAAPKPKAPENLRLSKEDGGRIRLSWDRQSGVSGYLLFVGKSSKAESMELYKSLSKNSGSVSFKPEKSLRYCCVCAYCSMSDGNILMSKPSRVLKIG